MASPIHDKGFWVNPCGFTRYPGKDGISKEKILDNYEETIEVAKIAYNQALRTKEFLASNLNSTFDLDSLENMEPYDFLSIPDVSEENFSSLTEEKALRESYRLIQSFGVSLEQILFDQDEINHLRMFQDMKAKMIELLCCLQTNLELFNMEYEDVTRDVMDPALRDLNVTKKKIRDYVILRDYIKATHYVIELMTYLKNAFAPMENGE